MKSLERKRKGFDQGFFYPDLHEQDQHSPNDLDVFLSLHNSDLTSESNEIGDSETIRNDNRNNTTYSVCGFVAKSNQEEDLLVHDDSIGKWHETIAFYKRHIRLLHQIPKGARAAAADKLSKMIDICLVKNNIISWRYLFLFSHTALCTPERDNKTSLT